MECSKCNYPINGKYCANCGLPLQLPRIDGAYILSEIGSVLSFQKGILFSIKELLIRPGKSIRTFILEDRNRLVKPVIFVIFCSFLYTIFQQLLHFEDGYIKYHSDTPSTALTIMQWIQGNYGYANILMSIFIAGYLKLFFRKYNYTFFEILILLLFVFGESMLIYSLFGILEGMTHVKFMFYGGLIGTVYTIWAIVQFFDQRKIGNYVKALLAFFIGLVSFTVLAVLFGVLIDVVKGS